MTPRVHLIITAVAVLGAWGLYQWRGFDGWTAFAMLAAAAAPIISAACGDEIEAGLTRVNLTLRAFFSRNG